jgi:hypothetical protein
MAPSRYWAAREQLLASGLMERQLSFFDVMRVGKRLYNRRNALRLYGMPPISWYARGIRILGRTSIEAHPDGPADEIGAITARVLDQHGVCITDLIDPFLGSGNLAYHIARHVRPQRIVGCESNPAICTLTAKSLDLLIKRRHLGNVDIVTLNADWSAAEPLVRDVPTLVILAPPWGAAYSDAGLDLRKTAPPIPETLSPFLATAATDLLFLVPIAGSKTFVESVPDDRRLNLIMHHPQKAAGFLLLRRQ